MPKLCAPRHSALDWLNCQMAAPLNSYWSPRSNLTQLVETVRGNDMYMLKAEVLLLTVWVRIAPLPSRPAGVMRLTGGVLELLVVLAESVWLATWSVYL